jgi:hypothetical protein
LNFLLLIHNRLGFSGRCTTQDIAVGPLYLWERVRVRAEGLKR